MSEAALRSTANKPPACGWAANCSGDRPVRALVMNYCLANSAAFHREDAGGYVFWSERVLELDAQNPQLASRLARGMDRWTHLAEPWRGAAREALQRVAARPTLSNDVREIVTKALDNQA